MTGERYVALHDDDASYVIDNATGERVRSWVPRQWKAANAYARQRNLIDQPPARWPSLYPGHRTEVIR